MLTSDALVGHLEPLALAWPWQHKSGGFNSLFKRPCVTEPMFFTVVCASGSGLFLFFTNQSFSGIWYFFFSCQLFSGSGALVTCAADDIDEMMVGYGFVADKIRAQVGYFSV